MYRNPRLTSTVSLAGIPALQVSTEHVLCDFTRIVISTIIVIMDNDSIKLLQGLREFVPVMAELTPTSDGGLRSDVVSSRWQADRADVVGESHGLVKLNLEVFEE